MITAVQVDDEASAREFLRSRLSDVAPEVQVLGEAKNIDEAASMIADTKPQLVFLDVEMPGGNGFDLLKRLGRWDFDVIFTTSHQHYAIQAIRFSALDYLLKPVDPQELGIAIGKAADATHLPQHPAQFMALLKNLAQRAENGRRIALPVTDGLEMVSIDDILYCESDGHYTTLRLVDKRRLTVSRNVGQFEEMLDKDQFIRVHHSFLVNMGRVSRYVKGEGGELIMADGSNVQVSRRKKQEVLDALARI